MISVIRYLIDALHSFIDFLNRSTYSHTFIARQHIMLMASAESQFTTNSCTIKLGRIV